MLISNYETHLHKDPNFPIIFHLDVLHKNYLSFSTHWHESVELLYFIEGEGEVLIDGSLYRAKAGDIVIFNSNHLHHIGTNDEVCRYYCMIIDKGLCDSHQIPVSDLRYSPIIQDGTACGFFDSIVQEMLGKKMMYKQQVMVQALSLMIHLTRYYSVARPSISGNGKRVEMVKAAIGYLQANFARSLTVDDVCAYVGFSKYYFLREFKASTGRTLVEYINFLRCRHARKLLSSGNYNVTQSASMSGFHNLSYFSKLYKKQNGVLPSREEEDARKRLAENLEKTVAISSAEES